MAHSCCLPNPLNSFHRGMFKLNTKFDAYLMLYSLSHFECDGHTEYMLTQRLPSPLTSTVKSSLFTHVHSHPLSLTARLHQCHPNHSCYVYNGWTFSRQTLCVHVCIKFNFRGSGREGERDGENHGCERETLICCLPYTP